MLKRTRTLIASITGTALEFYDFMLYAVFLESISKTYFSTSDLFINKVMGHLGFAVAFFMRPFGASLFGYIGDKWGRRKALILSISLMGLPTFLIGVLPSYEQIGVTASVILIFSRLIQGLCTGGEYNGSAIFALEHVGKRYPGMTGGFITGASVVGALLATFMGIILKQDGLPGWTWRLAFVLGGFISLVGLYIRLNTSESPVFVKAQKRAVQKQVPLLRAVTRDFNSSLTTFSIGILNGLLSYMLFKFLDLYLCQYLKMSSIEILKLSSVGIVCYILCAPFSGLLLDKIGGAKLLKRSCLFVFVSSLPLYFLIQVKGFVLPVYMFLGVMVASIAGPQHAFVQTLFPISDRYSGISFNYCLGMALGGGAGPLLMQMTVEKTQNLYAPAFFLMGASFLTYVMISIRSKSRCYG